VIGYTIKPNIYAGFAGRIMKIPYAANITGLGSTFQKEGILKKTVISMYKISLKNAKVVFFENEENRQVFIESKIVDKDKTCLINGAGVNLEHFGVLDYPGGDVTKFLFIGRIMREKGVDELFAAMKRLRADGVKCTIDVLGGFDEDYGGKIREYESEGWLHYHGYKPDVRPFIAESHCFVLPSWHEGMANCNLECAASGRPVITSNIHGCMEAVEDSVSGYLCERKNADDLYRVMKKFTELSYEERMTMGLAGRKRMEEMFDKNKVVEATIRGLME
jgi:galacturonosyltransferase